MSQKTLIYLSVSSLVNHSNKTTRQHQDRQTWSMYYYIQLVSYSKKRHSAQRNENILEWNWHTIAILNCNPLISFPFFRAKSGYTIQLTLDQKKSLVFIPAADCSGTSKRNKSTLCFLSFISSRRSGKDTMICVSAAQKWYTTYYQAKHSSLRTIS